MRGRRGDDDGEVPDPQLADAVDRGHASYVVLGSDTTADVLEPGERSGVGGVVERGDALATVVVADLADEEGESTGTVVAQRVDHLGDVERGVADADEAHEVTHAAECRPGRDPDGASACPPRLGRVGTVAGMSDSPGGPGQPGQGPDDNNPFKGTPFEQIFSQMGGFGAGGGMPDLNALMAQMQSLFAPHDGPVNWETVTDLARRTAAQEPDPTISAAQSAAVADAVRLADHWLDTTTEFPSGVSTTAAWSRAEWIVETLDVWKVLVEPIAGSATTALGEAMPEEMRQLAGPLMAMLGKASGAMVASQVGSGLGALAGDVLSASDIGLPLGPIGKAALLPTNVAAFAAELPDVTTDDVLLYLALREAAHQRLFAGVPWLRDHLIGAVAEYGAGMDFDTSGMESKLREIDMSNPAAMQDALAGGLFDPEPSAAQKAALEKLEVTLALVEGWVDEVVGQATAERMPAAAKLQETVRRRRAAGGPAEQTFATLRRPGAAAPPAA